MLMRLVAHLQTSHIMRGNSAGAVSAFVCTQNGAMPVAGRGHALFMAVLIINEL